MLSRYIYRRQQRTEYWNNSQGNTTMCFMYCCVTYVGANNVNRLIFIITPINAHLISTKLYYIEYILYKTHYNCNYIILYFIILYCVILYYNILYYIILRYIVLYYIILYYVTLYYILSYYIILYYIILYYIILYYIILYYIILPRIF